MLDMVFVLYIYTFIGYRAGAGIPILLGDYIVLAIAAAIGAKRFEREHTK